MWVSVSLLGSGFPVIGLYHIFHSKFLVGLPALLLVGSERIHLCGPMLEKPFSNGNPLSNYLSGPH
jgi:hypothetical protein